MLLYTIEPENLSKREDAVIGQFFFMLVFPLVLVSGCTSFQAEESPFISEPVLKQSIVETSLEVAVSQQDLASGGQPEEELFKRAEILGIQAIFKKWLNSGFLFQISDCLASGQDRATLIHRQGQFTAQLDKVTNNYSSRFSLRGEFLACQHLSGEIARLDEGKTMTASHQEVILRLNEPLMEDEAPYFLVARQETVQGIPILRLIGGGKVTDVLGKFTNARIIKVHKEIKVGDFAFLVRLFIEPAESLQAFERVPDKSETPVLDEVVVKPELEPEKKKMPSEPK